MFDNLVEFLNSEDTRLTIYQSLFRYLNIQTGLNIITSCDFPIGSGLGGSSALTTALLAAAKKLFNIPWSKLEIAKDAYKLERLSMKVAGGWQDQYASSIGGVNAILFKADSHDVLNINLNKSTFQELENSLYLCFSGISHDSSEVHKSISLSKQSTNNKLRKSAALAWQMLTILSSGKLTDFDKNINLNWRLKKEYSDSVSSVNLNETIDTFLKSGVKSAKILGAGGGGYFMFRVGLENEKKFKETCVELGIEYERINFDTEGCLVWQN